MTAAAKPEITSGAIYKVTIKATGKQCYAVPSDSLAGHFYMTCWDEASASWTCTCRAGEIAAEYGNKGASCKHTRAAQVSVKANLARRAKRAADEKAMQAFSKEMEVSQKGSLNGSSQGFSLLKK